MTKRSNPALWLLSLGNGGVDRPFNEAVGGTITEIDDYNGTGEKWRVHTFTGNGTLDVTTAVNPFRVGLIAGGNGAVGNTFNGNRGPEGASAIWQEQASLSVTQGSHPVVVGNGGQGSSPSHSVPGSAAGASTIFGLTAPGRGGPGGGPSGTPTASNITGSSVTYGLLCAGRTNGATNGSTPGQGGGGCSVDLCGGGHGYRGVVIVAYQIG